MKSNEMHDSLPEAETKKFFSNSLAECWPSDGTDPDRIRKDIVKLQEQLKLAEKSQAVTNLIRERGWGMYDVSDDVERSPDFDCCPFFVGTSEEYGNLMIDINKENESHG